MYTYKPTEDELGALLKLLCEIDFHKLRQGVITSKNRITTSDSDDDKISEQDAEILERLFWDDNFPWGDE